MKYLFSLLYIIAFFLPALGYGQSKLYLDIKLGANYTFAEGAHFGKGTKPFKAHSQISFDEQGVVLLRLQIKEKWSIATGYNGTTLGWAYSLQVPQKYTVNPFGGEQRSNSTGIYMHQFPILLGKRIGQYNIREIDTVRHIYLASFRLDAIIGTGLNWNNRSCSDCSQLSGGPLAYDIIEFKQSVIQQNRFGTFVIGGITARFYRLNKERLNLSVYYTQGLTDMILVPVEYKYNSQRGNTTLHVRGSGLSAVLGVPLHLKTFRK